MLLTTIPIPSSGAASRALLFAHWNCQRNAARTFRSTRILSVLRVCVDSEFGWLRNDEERERESWSDERGRYHPKCILQRDGRQHEKHLFSKRQLYNLEMLCSITKLCSSALVVALLCLFSLFRAANKFRQESVWSEENEKKQEKSPQSFQRSGKSEVASWPSQFVLFFSRSLVNGLWVCACVCMEREFLRRP